jgi:hypothetical protein
MLWGSSELLARATRGGALIENETDGAGLEHYRTWEPMGVSHFTPLDETCACRRRVYNG